MSIPLERNHGLCLFSILFPDKALLTIRHRSQILGKKVSPFSLKMTTHTNDQLGKGEGYNTNLQLSRSVGQFSKSGVVEEAHFLTEQTGEEERASVVPVHNAFHHLVHPSHLITSIVVHVHHKLKQQAQSKKKETTAPYFITSDLYYCVAHYLKKEVNFAQLP